MRDYFEMMDAGNAAQLEKLRDPKNVDKGGLDIPIDYGVERILDEWIELREEVKAEAVSGIEYFQRIRLEAADVANFAHMIILRCNMEIETTKAGERATREVH